MSLWAVSRRIRACPSGARRLQVMDFLFRASLSHQSDTPSVRRPRRRRSSPPPGRPTLITSPPPPVRAPPRRSQPPLLPPPARAARGGEGGLPFRAPAPWGGVAALTAAG